MDPKEERERDRCINVVILEKRPPLTVFQIDIPTRDSVQRNPTLAIYMGCDPFSLNQNLQSCHLGFWKSLQHPHSCVIMPYTTYCFSCGVRFSH